RHCHLPLLGNDLAHWKTFTSVVYRWFQHLRKSQLAMPPLHLHKGIDRPRDRHRAPAIAWNTLNALTSQSLQREVLGTAATAIDPVDLAVSGPAIQQKGIAPNVRRHWFHHTQGQCCGDRRVKRIAALFQDCYTGFCGQRLTSGNHTVARHDNGTPRGKPSPFYTAGLEHESSPLLCMLWNDHDDIAVAIEMNMVLRLHNER